MAAAVLPPNHNIGLSSSTNASPVMDSKSGVKQHENNDSSSKPNSPAQTKTSLPANQPNTQSEDTKPGAQTTEPLAPPPRPAPSNPAETPDYFSALHNNTGISGEFNPFEQSFGAPSAETPGGTRLPPVAALTSPAIGGANTNGGYNWNQSLRSGPLSPAMLEGPTGGDYFGNISSRGFPTPNESSLRTGLTPGGGGSMFPAPSPNSQALFNSLASGGATPGTLDFHRTAMNAAARNKPNTSQYPATSAAPNGTSNTAMDAQHDATDAANGLFMLAKGGQANQFAVPNQPSQPPMQTRGQDNKKNARNNGSIGSISGPDANESAESQEDTKPSTRGAKGKKNTKSEATTPARRKSEATAKGSNKRAKGNNGNANVDPALDPMDEDDDDDDSEGDDDMMRDGKDPKKMTDEEKRRNFLERNRVAALKCRQRKKQWLANLQAKVEMFSAENESLNTQVAQLHDEIRNLRTLLMGHKDCPVGHAQGIGQFLNGMQDPSGFGGHNPYGMPMANGPGMQPGMQRT